MNYIWKKLTPHKLTVTYDLENKHYLYKVCVANSVHNYMSTGELNEEVCLEQKENFYNTLHEVKKIEHDNILKYYLENLA